MTVICVALLCPVVITVLALLVQACVWYSSVLHPLMNFDASTVHDAMHPFFNSNIHDNVPSYDGNPQAISHDKSLRNADDVYLKYVIHIVEVYNLAGAPTPFQEKVVQSIKRHLLRTLGTIRHPSIEFKVVQSNAVDSELHNHIRFQQAADDEVFEPYLFMHDINAYISSPDSIYNGSTGKALGCTPITSCKVLTFAYIIPDYTTHAQPHKNDNYNTIHYKPLQLFNMPFTQSTSPQPPETITGSIVPQLGCFSALYLQNKQQYDTIDSDVIYNAATNSVQCLQKLLNIPNYSLTSSIDADYHSNFEAQTVIDSDRRLTFNAVQSLQFQRNRLALLTQSALIKLQDMIVLHGYNSDIVALLMLTAEQSNTSGEIFEILNSMKATVASDGTSPSCTADSACLHKLHTLVSKLYRLVLALETDPTGGLKAPAPIEQYFAIFGPYWLPILVPVYRALKSIAAT